MKKQFLILVYIMFGLFLLSSCMEGNNQTNTTTNTQGVTTTTTTQTEKTIEITIVGQDGQEKKYTIQENESFVVNYPKIVGTDYFAGCYANNKQYISSYGISIPWKESYPTKLTTKYLPILNKSLPTTQAFVDEVETISNWNELNVELYLEHPYIDFIKSHPSAIVDVTLEFDHYEAKSLVFANWSNYYVYLDDIDNRVDQSSFESNSGYEKYNKTFRTTAEKISSGIIGITISRPAACASTENSYYKNFKGYVRILTEDSSDMTLEKLGTSYDRNYIGYPFDLSPSNKSSNIELTYPEFVKELASKYQKRRLTLSFNVLSFGSNTWFVQNWLKLHVMAKDEHGTKIKTADVELKQVGGYGWDSCSMILTYDEIAAIDRFELYFDYEDSNISLQTYYIKKVELNAKFSDYDFKKLDYMVNEVAVDSGFDVAAQFNNTHVTVSRNIFDIYYSGGAKYNDDKTAFTINSFNFGLRMNYDWNKIPVGNETKEINDDANAGDKIVVGFDSKPVSGRGCALMKLTYSDGTSETIVKGKIFDDAVKDGVITLFTSSDLKAGKLISKLEITIIYEIVHRAKGWFDGGDYSNWRTDVELNFA